MSIKTKIVEFIAHYAVESTLAVIIPAFFGWLFGRKKKTMSPLLEGKELVVPIGKVGSFEIDVKPDVSVDLALKMGLDQVLTPGIKLKLNVEGLAEIDAIELLAIQAAKSDNKILKFLAEQALKLKGGAEVHADVVAAAHAAAPQISGAV